MGTAHLRSFLLFAALAALGWMGPRPARAQEQGHELTTKAAHGEAAVEDLTLLNFFDGWDQAWIHRHRTTPDMALLKVTTNFLERELRLDYAHTSVSRNPKLHSTDFGNALIAYGLSRRLMIEVISNYQWNNGVPRSSANGPGAAALARVQLVDTPHASYALQARVSAPNRAIGGTQTSLVYALAGWQDLRVLSPELGRLGLYYSFQYENLQGFHRPGVRMNDVAYDVSLAETWTGPRTPGLGNFTTFLEAYGTTDLDGSGAGKTVFTLTPGFRFWFIPENSLTAGVDLPVSHGAPLSAVYRATYILNF